MNQPPFARLPPLEVPGEAPVERVARMLDALARHHKRSESRLYRLSGRRFQRACAALRRFWYQRDKLRVRLQALRCKDDELCDATRSALRAAWHDTVRSAKHLDRLVGPSQAHDQASSAAS